MKPDYPLFVERMSALCSARPPVVRDPRLMMESEGNIQVYYAPFEYVNPTARLVLVGITPGPTQMVNANMAARDALLRGCSAQEAMRLAKETGAFSGEPMRSNLIKQLNHWGVHKWLKLQDSSELFSTARGLLQTTSLLRFPTFVGEEDYRGSPDMTRHPLLRKMLEEHFVREISDLSESMFFSLGPQVQKVMDVLVLQGAVPADRVVRGMLHPSPNCTYRIKYLVGDRSQPIPHATNPQPYDTGRENFRRWYGDHGGSL